MFIFTAKFNKKKAIIAVLILAVILVGIIMIAGRNNAAATASAAGKIVKSNDDRISFLESLGWTVSDQPIEEQTVVIPKKFDTVYEEYNQLQLEQSFDLTKYGGVEATRYTYDVTNYPGQDTGVVVDIIVYRNTIIAGDIQSTSLDGFMHGLEFPQQEKN